MGTWGAGAFENDAALDFVHEIESAQDLVDAHRSGPARSVTRNPTYDRGLTHQGTTGCTPPAGNTCSSMPDACAPDRYTRCVAVLKSVGFA